MDEKIATNTAMAVKKIAEKLNLSADVVRLVIDEYANEIVQCIDSEIPFTYNGLGKFYYTYLYKPTAASTGGFFKDKVRREVCFKIQDNLKMRLNNWVHNLGFRNNLKKEMARLKMRPEEISKKRNAKILAEQRAVGFRPDLLFDEEDVPQPDRDALEDIGDAPTVQEVINRLGFDFEVNQ